MRPRGCACMGLRHALQCNRALPHPALGWCAVGPRGAGFAIDPPLEGGIQCLPKVLSGEVLAREWWQDGRGWITSILDAMAQVGVPVPGWVYQSLGNPLDFFKVFTAQNFFMGEGEDGKAARLVALSLIGGLGLAFTAMVATGGNFGEPAGNSIASMPPQGLGINPFPGIA